MNKKGSPIDIMYLVLLVFVMVIFYYYGHYAFAAVAVGLNSSSSISNTSVTILESGEDFYKGQDNLFPFIIAGMCVLLFVSGMLIDTYPVFAAALIFIDIIIILVSGWLANFFEQIAENPQFVNERSIFSISTYFLEHLPIIALLFGMSFIAGLYVKQRVNQ